MTTKPNPPIQPDPNNPSPLPVPPEPVPAVESITLPVPEGAINLLDPAVIKREQERGAEENEIEYGEAEAEKG